MPPIVTLSKNHSQEHPMDSANPNLIAETINLPMHIHLHKESRPLAHSVIAGLFTRQ